MKDNKIVISGNYFLDIQIIPISGTALGTNHKANSEITKGGILNVSNYLELLRVRHVVSYTVGKDDFFQKNEKYDSVYATHQRMINDGSSDVAIILLDKFGQSRTSFVIDGSSRKHKPNFNSVPKFHHISYLDNLPNYGTEFLKTLRRQGCLVTADLCLNAPSQSEISELMCRIQFIDYLIISDSEFYAYFKDSEIEGLLENKLFSHLKFIIHRKNGFRIIDVSGSVSEYLEVKPIKNVLGAGDCFVANFLNNISLNLNLNLYETVLKTFWQTSKILLEERN